MIPERETPQAIDERRTGNTKYRHFSSASLGKRKVIGVFVLVLYSLIVITVSFYQAKSVGSDGRIWRGFWPLAIFIGVWLIVAIMRVLRKGARN
jgi:hypothetical protein